MVDPVEDISGDVGRPLLPKMTERVFVQIIPFNPVPESNLEHKTLIKTKVIEDVEPIGYVYIPIGLSKLTSHLVGYWIIIRNGSDIFKIKTGDSELSFRAFLNELRWANVEQIYM